MALVVTGGTARAVAHPHLQWIRKLVRPLFPSVFGWFGGVGIWVPGSSFGKRDRAGTRDPDDASSYMRIISNKTPLIQNAQNAADHRKLFRCRG